MSAWICPNCGKMLSIRQKRCPTPTCDVELMPKNFKPGENDVILGEKDKPK